MEASYALIAAVIIFLIIVADGLKRLAGTSTPKLRPRGANQTLAEWLMGKEMLAKSDLKLPDLRVNIERSAAFPSEWSCNVPPQLAASHGSHLWLGERLSTWVFPDTVIWPTPVEIEASPAEVWDVLMDFDKYGEWNGFHRKMEIVDKPNGSVGLRMTFGLGPVMGTLVETSTIYYVDEIRKIFIYGLRGDEGPCSMRVVWLVETPSGSTVFHSYDMIGGYPALICRVHIQRMVQMGFDEQHLAIRDRVHALKRKEREVAAFLDAPTPTSTSAEALGVCLVTGGTGFMGSHLTRLLAGLSGVSHVHVMDLHPPNRPTLSGVAGGPLPPNVTFHKGSISDAAFVSQIVNKVKPETIFHAASIIDLRPGKASDGANQKVNVDGTMTILSLAKEHNAKRLVYTSSIECAYHNNTCEGATEEGTPYIAHPTNPYQRTKAIAERAVLNASSEGGLRTVAIRPSHIFGTSEHDDEIGKMIRDVPVNFEIGVKLCDFSKERKGAPMSMVHVENCAFAHILAACQLTTNPKAHGRAYFATDFDENIVQIYHALAGRPPPVVCLPHWLLLILVRVSMALHIIVLTLTFGAYGFLGPKNGLHDGAIAAALPCTVTNARARTLLGYDGPVTRDDAVADDGKAPLIGAGKLNEAIKKGCERAVRR